MKFTTVCYVRKSLTISVLLLIVITPLMTNAQSAVPSLYYYDRKANAFVIEHADGTDRHIFANFTLSSPKVGDEVQNIIVGPGWSPSGKWFAWRESTNYGVRSPAYLASRETTPVAILKGRDVAFMQWSPVADYLMVTVSAKGQLPAWDDTYVIDLEHMNQPVLMSMEEKSIHDAYVFIGWTADGQYIAQYINLQDGGWLMQLFALDGLTGETRELDATCTYPAWSKDGKVAYIDPSGKWLVLENIAERQSQQIAAPPKIVRRIAWSADGKYALVYTSDDCLNTVPKFRLWIVSFDSGVSRLISDDVQLPSSASVSPSLLDISVWSDDNRYVSFTSENKLFVFDVAQSTPIQVTPNATGTVSKAAWLGDSKLAFMWSDQGSTDIEVFDPSNQQLLTSSSDQSVTQFAFSHDDSYLAYSSNGLHLLIQLTQRDVQVEFPYHDYSDDLYIGAGNIHQIIWHPSDAWVIVKGGDTIGRVYVSNADGTTKRELTMCSSSASCFGWVPQ
jgi:hypothetical protein